MIWHKFEFDDERVIMVSDTINCVHYPCTKVLIDEISNAINFFKYRHIDISAIIEYAEQNNILL